MAIDLADLVDNAFRHNVAELLYLVGCVVLHGPNDKQRPGSLLTESSPMTGPLPRGVNMCSQHGKFSSVCSSSSRDAMMSSSRWALHAKANGRQLSTVNYLIDSIQAVVELART